jgi:hypothetical protein
MAGPTSARWLAEDLGCRAEAVFGADLADVILLILFWVVRPSARIKTKTRDLSAAGLVKVFSSTSASGVGGYYDDDDYQTNDL